MRAPNMKILSFGQKGGSGRTTMVVNVGSLAMERNIACTVIDADRQKNSARFFARMTNQEYDGQDLQCGSVFVTGDVGAIDNPGLVLVDCPPVLTTLRELPEVDLVLTPIDGQWAADGSVNVIQEMQRTRPGTRMVVWVNKHYDSRFGAAELKQVGEELGVELFRFPIAASEHFKRSEMLSVPVWKVPYATRSTGVMNFKLFAEWVTDGCNPSATYAPDDVANRAEFAAYQTRKNNATRG